MFWSILNDFDGIALSLGRPENLISSLPVGSRETVGFERTVRHQVHYIRMAGLAHVAIYKPVYFGVLMSYCLTLSLFRNAQILMK